MGTRAKHPYVTQPDQAYWPKTVPGRHPLDIADWYHKKFSIDGKPIAAAGSCFAQHIGRHLRRSGFTFVDTEPPPDLLAPEQRTSFGYEMYSARYGNVYTSRQLLQLFQRSFGEFVPEETSWVKGQGVVDPFRPTIEPEPFSTVNELAQSRERHLERVREMFETAEVFVFTLGLTEAWISVTDGSVVPLAPGTAGGVWDNSAYRFQNLSYPEIMEDLHGFLERFRRVQPNGQVILTVSPVPLVATATEEQVVVATSYSKSVLRAVAGALAAEFDYVDYFPSFEIVSSNPMRSYFFEPDMREVSSHGVSHVMDHFFAAHRPPSRATGDKTDTVVDDDEDVVCDQELLAEFGEAS